MFNKLVAATTVALAATCVSAQTFTACDPTKKTCPNDKAVGAKIVDVDFTQGANSFFTVAEGTTLTYDKTLGAVFTINKETDAPTITSSEYIFFGQVDVTVRAANGVGIVTSFVLQSDDLDEIDWEWLGGDKTQVQTNYFSKGCTTVYDRGGFSPVTNPQDQFDTYTIKWTPTVLQWIINGAVVRELQAANANGCDGFPQTPMQIKLGTWVGGSSTAAPGTVQWAGGLTNFAQAPFVGYYQSIKIQDYMGGQGATEASEYQYGDHSGTWQSIKIIGGSGNDTSSSSTETSTAASSTKTSSSKSGSSATASSSVATTMTTATASGSASFSNATSTGSGSSSSSTATRSSSGASTSSTTAPSAAGKVALSLSNIALMGAAVFFGSFML
ncbi:glycoside hydrolase [Diplogelasinospora grovesii]|uniref:Crh-like protein n=1 Tax=Diplogelasinospora grovesii TaxID=303347 RepID=A0AAN6N2K2_9PEZI|nr:glycoside hydrolase [Diplogelasinospora grovesii]